MASIWIGSTSGDWEDANNWIGGVPAANADVVFPTDDLVTNAPSTNLDRTADTGLAGLDLDTIIYARGATYDIGTSSAPLKCTVDETFQIIGDGRFYFRSDTGTGGHTTGKIIVDSGNMQGALVLTGDTDVDRLDVLAGYVTVALTSTTLTVLNMSLSDRTLSPVVTIGTATLCPTRRQYAGRLTSSNAASSGETHDLYGGTYLHHTALGATTAPVVRVHGGYFDYRGGAPAAGTALTIDAFGGTVDLRTPSAVDGLLIVNQLNVYPRVNILRGSIATITTTNYYGDSSVA